MNTCIIFAALLAVTVANLRSYSHPIEDFPHLQTKYPDFKYVVPFESSRILGGELAVPGQFPYQVLMYTSPGGGYYSSSCGASLISSEYVLTAAHCVVDENIREIYLKFGVHNKEQEEPEQVTVHVPRDHIIIHPEFELRPVMNNDIALIKLDEPITFTPRIKAVALPTRSQAGESLEGDIGIATGWGLFTQSPPTLSDVLRYVQLPIISNAQCNDTYLTVTASQICGDGANGRSACRGDSGSSFVVIRNGEYILVGIDSFSGRFCDKELPSVFTRVTSYLDFIGNNSNIVIAP